jgi:hypothetical protein
MLKLKLKIEKKKLRQSIHACFPSIGLDSNPSVPTAITAAYFGAELLSSPEDFSIAELADVFETYFN